MKIACVAYLHGAGGAERQIIMLANAMVDMGHEVHLLVLASNNQKYSISNKIKVYDLSYAELQKGPKLINRFKALYDALRQIKADVSIHFWLQSAYFTALMRKKIVGKIIYAERGDPGDKEYLGLLGAIRKLSFYRINGFVFQSKGALNYFNKEIRSRATIIQNAISVSSSEYILPCKRRSKKIINVGRLHEQKNQKLLIDAFARISKKLYDYKVEIYGDGLLKDYLEKYIEQKKLSDRINILPSRKDIFNCIYDSSLFVLTSDYEGMPNALMEAMALGIPCISTDCKPGGARDLITSGKNGIIVPCNDANALSSAIEDLICDRNKAEAFAREAQKIRLTNSSKQTFLRWEKYIEDVITKR